MSTPVFLAVILAALLHATWNAVVKGGTDKHVSMTAVVIGHLPFALAVLPFVPSPAPESLPYLAAGIALHFGYQLFLLYSYKAGDLTQVYPIARGSAPLIVAAISVLFLGVTLSGMELLAIAVIGIGILSISLTRHQTGARNPRGAGLALITGCFIAAYSLVDGTGARVAGSPLGFYGWLAIGNAAVMAAFMAATSPTTLRDVALTAKRVFFLGGAASFGAYALVMWAFTKAPIPIVTALRESSIIFALIIGVLVLREKLNLAKLASTAFTLIGVALLRLAKP